MSQFDEPSGLAIDEDDNLYIVDRKNKRIQIFNTSGNFVEVFGAHGNGDGEVGQPVSIAASPDGTILYVNEEAVNDQDGDRVQIFQKQ